MPTAPTTTVPSSTNPARDRLNRLERAPRRAIAKRRTIHADAPPPDIRITDIMPNEWGPGERRQWPWRMLSVGEAAFLPYGPQMTKKDALENLRLYAWMHERQFGWCVHTHDELEGVLVWRRE